LPTFVETPAPDERASNLRKSFSAERRKLTAYSAIVLQASFRVRQRERWLTRIVAIFVCAKARFDF
jgi:hypothetical protein